MSSLLLTGEADGDGQGNQGRGAFGILGEAIVYALSTEAPTVPSPHAPDRPSPEARSLTRREREAAGLVAQGLTNRRIAQELVVSEHTVRQHVKNILKKLGGHSHERVAARLHDQ